MPRRYHRRRFLRQSAVLGSGAVILSHGWPARGQSPNEKLNVAVIGLGGRGSANLGGVSGENVVALCDVDDERAGKAYDKFPKARKYYDFRKMLDEMERQIDALVIATPDHTHAVIAARAMKRGKHVYVEKPIAHDVGEARTLRSIANEQQVATQQGNQGMATDSFRRTL